MSEPYLPQWATVQEAGEWLEFKTGQHWPLPRILETGVPAAIHLIPSDNPSPEELREVFGGSYSGFMALIQPADLKQLAASREEFLPALFGLPDGRVVSITPPPRVPASEVRLSRSGVQKIAERLTQGAKFDVPSGPLLVRGEGVEILIPPYGVELHGLPVKIELTRFQPLPQDKPETPQAPASEQAAEPRTVAPSWPLKEPQRCDGLATAIYRALKTARDAGEARPNANALLELWRVTRPAEIIRVNFDGCDFFDRIGDEARATAEQIRRRIDTMTTRSRHVSDT